MSNIPDIWKNTRFKVGDKVWYNTGKNKIPCVIKDDFLVPFGEKRDESVMIGHTPTIQMRKDRLSKVSGRRKHIPGETHRLQLSKLGLEKDYIKWRNTVRYEQSLREKRMSYLEEKVLELVEKYEDIHFLSFKENFCSKLEYSFKQQDIIEAIENLKKKRIIKEIQVPDRGNLWTSFVLYETPKSQWSTYSW